MTPESDRPSLSPDLATVHEPARRTPVLRQAEVLVVGGGLAGVAAAVASARNGARTTLIERSQALGGIASAAMPGSFGILIDWEGNKILGGILDEIIERLAHRQACRQEQWRLSPTMERQIGLEEYFTRHPRAEGLATRFDFEQLKYVCDDMVRESGVDVLFDTLVVGAVQEGANLHGVIAEGKSGRFAVTADVLVDASGDGDVAALAGASFAKGREGDGLLQPVTLAFTLGDVDVTRAQEYETVADDRGFAKAIAAARRDGIIADFPCERFAAWRPLFGGAVWFNATRLTGLDATKTEEISRALLECRRQIDVIVDFLRKCVPGFEKARVLATSSQLGVRETRRIVGEHVLTEEDVLGGRRFPDVVVRRAVIIDVHNPGGQGFHPIKMQDAPFFEIPYRCLLPQGVNNLLVAGRCISTTHVAHGATRAMVTCVATGEAAGTAAALASHQKVTPNNLPAAILQRRLREQGVLRGPEAVESTGLELPSPS